MLTWNHQNLAYILIKVINRPFLTRWKNFANFYFKIEIGLLTLDVTFNSLLYAKPILHLLKVDHVMIVVTMGHAQETGRQVEATVQDTTA